MMRLHIETREERQRRRQMDSIQMEIDAAERRGYQRGFNEARDSAVKVAQREAIAAMDGVSRHFAARKSTSFMEGKVAAYNEMINTLSALKAEEAGS